MKNLFIRIAILIFLNPLALRTSAQIGVVELQFTATEVDGKVYLDWTMNLGQTCNGIDITRSTDGLSFSPIGNIAGVCGSPFESESYFFIDENPFPNQINYYRLSLGNLGPSKTLAVEVINLEESGIQVRPHPIVQDARIYFDNDRKDEHIFTLFSPNGKTLFTQNTRSGYFQINAAHLAEGFYIFKIETADGASVVRSRVVVAR